MIPQLSTNINTNDVVITLKEITDLLSVEHNKAMKVVERLTQEPSFGGVEKLATPTYNPNGGFNRNIQTYKLNKKQAIAVGAKLNDSLLMKLIDRLEELEANKPAKVMSHLETAKMLVQSLEQNKSLNEKIEADKPKVSYANAVASTVNSCSIRDWIKSVYLPRGVKQKDIFAWLDSKYTYKAKNGERRAKADYEYKGYFELMPLVTATNAGSKERFQLKITGDGQIYLSTKLQDFLNTREVA